MVARFDGDDERYGFSAGILSKLHSTEDEFPEATVQSFGETIKADQNLEAVRKRAKSRGGRILIWGWYLIGDLVWVNARFEMLQTLPHIQLHALSSEYKVTLAELAKFEIQQKLASQSNYLALLIFGLMRYEKKDYDGAIKRFTQALSESQALGKAQITDYRVNLGVARLYRGNSYLRKGDFTKSVDDLSAAIQTFQKDERMSEGLFEATVNRGLAYDMRGDFDDSLKDYNKAMQLNPDSPLVYNNLGFLYVKRGKIEEAIKWYNKAISIHPTVAAYYQNRGNAWLSRDADSALNDFSRALSIEPPNPELYYDFGHAYRLKLDFKNAIINLDKAIEQKPTMAMAYHCRADCRYTFKRDVQGGIEDNSLAILNDPKFAPAYFDRAFMYANNGYADKAIADFRSAIDLEYKVADSYTNIGILYSVAKGNNVFAIESLNSAIKSKPDSAVAYYCRAIAYSNVGELGKAKNDLQRVLSLPNDPIMKINPETKQKLTDGINQLDKGQKLSGLGMPKITLLHTG